MRHISLIIIIAFLSCKEEVKKTALPKKKHENQYFSLKLYFEQELRKLDSTPFYIYKITTSTTGKRDSAQVLHSKVGAIVEEFIKKDLVMNHIEDKYRESNFFNNTLGCITLTYTAMDPTLEIQSILILMKEETSRPDKVYIKTVKSRGDTTIYSNYTWNTGKSFSINRSMQFGNGKELNESEYVNWDDN